MAFRNGAWAKVWTVEPHEKFTKIRFSTSVKNKDTGEYQTDFSGFASLLGGAHAKAAHMKDGDRIRIGDCAVTNRYDKEANREYTNFIIYAYEDEREAAANPVSHSTTAAASVARPAPVANRVARPVQKPVSVPEPAESEYSDDEELPF